jgi:hypothetical protein
MLMFRAATFAPGAATGRAGCHGLGDEGYNAGEGKQKDQAESSATVQGAAHPTSTDPTPGQHLGDEDTMSPDGEARIFLVTISQVTGPAIT